MSETEQFIQVRKRRVFYIPGYDPIHPRRYRELYRKEGAEQAQISGYQIALKPKTTPGLYGWHVQAQIDGACVDADIEVLVWSDIVRNSMAQGIWATYLQLLRTAGVYIGSGALWRLMQLRKGPVIAALYPVLFLLLQLVLALGLAALLGWGLSWLHPWLALLGLGVVPPVLYWFRKHDNKFFAYYLMHDYAYSARSQGENPPELEARIATFTAAIRAAMQTDTDEVLVVGHSSGAHLAVSILADLIREGLPTPGPQLNLLTLGQVVPMVSFLPRAWRLRSDLAYLSERSEIAWVDVTAPGDGCAFALCDPVSVSGVAGTGKRWPLVFSAAFTQTLSPAKWNALKRRFFRLHFQYLCAFDRPRDYDYFRITAGPQTLRQRYSRRKASKSRIERAVSKYVSVSP
ncbi:hypothetical protein [Thalassovita sp.]|uniref:hypothetical protein n=1 Tax=Thalassovita sp. TaxID=1979401 RepID=UPI0029DE7E7E|nr:hypothetical protein [Thalassovita sp.]